MLLVGGGMPANAATFTVNSTADAVDANPGDGLCDDGSGNCTLRAAIQETNALAGADDITLPAGTYTLSITGTGEDGAASGDLDVIDAVTITGDRPATTIIDGGDIDRVVDVAPVGSTAIVVNLSGLTIRNGSVPGKESGGGVRNRATLALTGSTVSGNAGGNGGGIHNLGIMMLSGSTVSDNRVAGGGGGVSNALPGDLSLTNVTISRNTGCRGGGMFNEGDLKLTNVTVSANTASCLGGGIRNDDGFATLKNTMVANSTSVFGGISDDCAGSVAITSEGHNLDSDGTCGLSGTGDISSTDPLLGPLADNGGPTFTHALLAGSPAIDAGSGDCPPPATDQRGVTRPQGAACDIGAYEFEAPDSDGDGFPDSVDGCPTVPTPWLTPFGDDDCDGFTTTDENFIGTDPNLACGPNAWPPDHNSDGLISISDVLLMKASFGAKTPDDPIYDARRDLNPDGKISISDVLMMREFFDQECT